MLTLRRGTDKDQQEHVLDQNTESIKLSPGYVLVKLCSETLKHTQCKHRPWNN